MNTCYITSFRCSSSFSYYCVSDCTSYIHDTNPILLPSQSCCPCCANSFSKNTISPNFLYGLRQSRLISYHPARKVIMSGAVQSYPRFPICYAEPKCNYQKSHSFKERISSGRRGRWRNGNFGYLINEERGNTFKSHNADDADLILSLLTEEVSEDILDVRERSCKERNGRSARISQVEKTKKRDKVKNGSSKFKYQSVESGSREEDNRYREVERSKQERKNEKEKKIKNEKTREKKGESSCSSYYSLSSLEENESDNEVQNKEDEIEIVRDSSSEYNRNQNVEYEEKITSERNQTQEIHLEKKGSGANRVEFDWRKKSEKKLAEVSIEQEESKKESSHRLFSSSEININHNAKNRETKSTSALRIDEVKREKFSEESNEVTRQSESKLKYDRLKETEQIKSSVDKASSSSDKQYKGRDDYRVGAVQQQLSKASHIQESGSSDNYNRVEQGESSELVTKKTNLRRRSQQITEISDTLDGNTESVVMSERRSSARIKNHKEASSSYQESEKQHSQLDSKTGESGSSDNYNRVEHGELSQLVTKKTNLRRRSQQITEIPDTFDANTESVVMSEGRSSDRIKNHEEASSSFQESEKQHTQMNSKTVRRLKSDKESHIIITDAENVSKSGYYTGASSEEKPQTNSPISQLDSADKSQKFATHFINEFVEKAKDAISTSEIQNKQTTQPSSRDSQPKEQDLRRSSRSSGAKGPSDEMWALNNPSLTIEEPPKTEAPADSKKVVVRRSGRSMWSIVSDIIRMRWGPRSETRSSPNRSTSSEAWFSGQEQEGGGQSQREASSDGDLLSSKGKSTSSTEETSAEPLEDRLGTQITRPTAPIPATEETSAESLQVRVGTQITRPKAPISATEETSTESLLVSLGTQITRPTASMTATEESSAEPLKGSLGTQITRPSPEMRMRRSPPVREEIVSAEIKEVSGTESKDEEVKRTKLQRSKQLPKDRFDEWEEAFVVENEQRKMDEMFMKEALLEAKKAGDMWEVPVGAVLVHHGKIIARGYNLVEELRDSTAHAEMNCIREASNVLQSWRLSETTLYVTLEPCPMCAGAILQARVETVVWGAPNKLLGADGSWIRLFPNGGEEGSETASAPVHPFHPNMKVRRGVLSSECGNVMQEFFQFRRRKKEKKPETAEPPPTPPPSCLPISNNSSNLLTKMHHVFHSSFCL